MLTRQQLAIIGLPALLALVCVSNRQAGPVLTGVERERYQIVQIYRNKASYGFGLWYRGREGEGIVITTAHHFSDKSVPAWFSCSALVGPLSVRFCLERIDFRFVDPETKAPLDLAQCRIGPARLITTASGFKPGVWPEQEEWAAVQLPLPVHLVSLKDDSAVPLIGLMRSRSGAQYGILLYASEPGESGLPFLGPAGEFYILSSGFKVNDYLRQALGLAPEVMAVSIAAAVRIQDD